MRNAFSLSMKPHNNVLSRTSWKNLFVRSFLVAEICPSTWKPIFTDFTQSNKRLNHFWMPVGVLDAQDMPYAKGFLHKNHSFWVCLGIFGLGSTLCATHKCGFSKILKNPRLTGITASIYTTLGHLIWYWTHWRCQIKTPPTGYTVYCTQERLIFSVFGDFPSVLSPKRVVLMVRSPDCRGGDAVIGKRRKAWLLQDAFWQL